MNLLSVVLRQVGELKRSTLCNEAFTTEKFRIGPTVFLHYKVILMEVKQNHLLQH